MNTPTKQRGGKHQPRTRPIDPQAHLDRIAAMAAQAERFGQHDKTQVYGGATERKIACDCGCGRTWTGRREVAREFGVDKYVVWKRIDAGKAIGGHRMRYE